MQDILLLIAIAELLYQCNGNVINYFALCSCVVFLCCILHVNGNPAVDGYIRKKKIVFPLFLMKMMWRCLELWLDKIFLLNMLFSS